MSATRVKPETIESAVTALLQWKETESKSEKPQLLPQEEFFYLTLTLVNMPQKGGRANPYKIPLPHPLIQDSEICLIIDDKPTSKLTSKDVKKKVKSENIPVSKVLKFSKLKTDYKPFEAKRKLCDSYDMFFAAKGVIPLLPKLLGKTFFKKKKLPLPIDLTHKNWKEQIERGCSSGLFYMKGTCSVVKVGRVSMTKEEIVENVVEGINGVIEYVPKLWEGVRSLHLKLSGSPVLPLYQTVPTRKLKIQGVREAVETVEEEIESEVEVKEVKKKDGKLGKKNKKGRIHEVRYMDVNSTGEDELGSDGDEDEKESEKINDEEEGVEELGKKTKKVGKGGRVDANDENESEESDKEDFAVKEVEIKKKKEKGNSRKGRVMNDKEEGVEELDKKTKKVGKGGRVDANDENESEESDKEDFAVKEVEIKKKKEKSNSRKGRVMNDKNVEKPAKKMKKKADGEEQENVHLPVKSMEESSGKKGKKKSGLGTTKNNSGKKVKISK